MAHEGMKCPKCDNYLDKEDIEVIKFRGRLQSIMSTFARNVGI